VLAPVNRLAQRGTVDQVDQVGQVEVVEVVEVVDRWWWTLW
jgi:hypothetical protein